MKKLIRIIVALTALSGLAFADAELLRDQSLKQDQNIWTNNRMYELIVQGDGNLVVYRAREGGGAKVIWASNTGNLGPGAELIVQGDGNVVLYHGGRGVWETGTTCNDTVRLRLKEDGRLLVVKPNNGRVLWSSHSEKWR